MPNEDISSLIHEGETCFQRKDYEKAAACFNKVVKQAPTYAWGHAHLGETYFAMAQAEEDSQLYGDALRCFNRALGVNESERQAPPQLQLGDNYSKYAWALAHRGELLRVIGYQGGIFWNEKDVFQEAVECFNKAIQLDDKYSWAYAHRAATHCSFRDGKYKQALQDLNTALELTDYFYPWCLAYKAVAYTLLRQERHAFYNLFSAVVQDKNILNQLIYPARELQQHLPPEMRYLEAMVQYTQALNLPRDNSYRLPYIQYHNAVVHKCSLEFEEGDSLSEGAPWSDSTPLPDKEETKETIKGAILNACAELTQLAEAQIAAESQDSGLKEYEDTLKAAIIRSCKELQELAAKLSREEVPHIYYIIGGLHVLLDKRPEAVAWLKKALHLRPKLQEQAAQDMAWYWLRNDASFKALTKKKNK